MGLLAVVLFVGLVLFLLGGEQQQPKYFRMKMIFIASNIRIINWFFALFCPLRFALFFFLTIVSSSTTLGQTTDTSSRGQQPNAATTTTTAKTDTAPATPKATNLTPPLLPETTNSGSNNYYNYNQNTSPLTSPNPRRTRPTDSLQLQFKAKTNTDTTTNTATITSTTTIDTTNWLYPPPPTEGVSYGIQYIYVPIIYQLAWQTAKNYADSCQLEDGQTLITPPNNTRYFYPDTFATNLALLVDTFKAPQPQIVHAGTPRPTNSHSLLFALFLAILSLVSLTRLQYFSYWHGAYRAVLNFNLSRQFYDDWNQFKEIPALLMDIISVLTFAGWIFLMANYFGFKWPNNDNIQINLPIWTLYPVLTVALGSLFTIRIIRMRLLANVLPHKTEILFYLLNERLAHFTTSIILLPLLFAIAFGNDLVQKIAIYTSFAIFLLLIIYKIYRGLLCSQKIIKMHKFHFFAYLCTLEIAPIIILYKLTARWL